MSLGLGQAETPVRGLAPELAPGLAQDAVVSHQLLGTRLAGIGLTLLSILMFAGTNALAKWLNHAVPVGEVLFARAALGGLLIAPFVSRADLAAMVAGGRPWLHALRMSASAVEVCCFYWAISDLPLADGSTIYLAGPIYVTALSAIYLRERVGWHRWAAVLVGFIGVLVALRPGGMSLTPHAMVAVIGSVLYAISLVATRGLRATPNSLLAGSQMAALLVISGGSALAGWVVPGATEAALMGVVGLVSLVSYLCVNRGLQLAPASVVAPFNYASILCAVALGYAVFGDIPGPATLTGAAIIVCAGLFILLGERRHA
jgi:drug/metabolite transporter (DMT)-like permease